MNQQSVTVRVILEEVTCCVCGITFAVPRGMGRREDHKDFFCPNGHSLHFPEKTEAERLERQLAQLRLDHNQALYEKGRLEVTLMDKAKELKNLKKRAKAGTCLFCHRHFANVQRHMDSKHGDEGKGE